MGLPTSGLAGFKRGQEGTDLVALNRTGLAFDELRELSHCRVLEQRADADLDAKQFLDIRCQPAGEHRIAAQLEEISMNVDGRQLQHLAPGRREQAPQCDGQPTGPVLGHGHRCLVIRQ